jgi:hypothetical protein
MAEEVSILFDYNILLILCLYFGQAKHTIKNAIKNYT